MPPAQNRPVYPRWLTSPVVLVFMLFLVASGAASGTVALATRDAGWGWDVFKGYAFAIFFAALALNLRRQAKIRSNGERDS